MWLRSSEQIRAYIRRLNRGWATGYGVRDRHLNPEAPHDGSEPSAADNDKEGQPHQDHPPTV